MPGIVDVHNHLLMGGRAELFELNALRAARRHSGPGAAGGAGHAARQVYRRAMGQRPDLRPQQRGSLALLDEATSGGDDADRRHPSQPLGQHSYSAPA